MPPLRPLVLYGLIASLAAVLGCARAQPLPDPPRPARHAGQGIEVGLEYANVDHPNLVAPLAEALADTGMHAIKPFPNHINWGEMQRGPRAAIDFDPLDAFVRAYQAYGFTAITIALKSHCRWGSKDYGVFHSPNPSPKPEHLDAYARWVGAVVERYDMDGRDDMPGLRFPLTLYEIGSELSAYEPEPIGEYLVMLERAYRAAHEAFPGVRVTHAAIHCATAFRVPTDPMTEPAIQAAFAGMHPRANPEHRLASARALFDRPDLFDVVNLHALADPIEIDDLTRWVRFETQARGYEKPILISDVVPSPLIAQGPATTCEGPPEKLGVMVRPAREEDRCRLAELFAALVRDEPEALRWVRALVATDMVQRTVIAADHGVFRINLAFTIDLPGLTWRIAQAAAGTTAWAGAVDHGGGKVTEKRPLYYAIRQMMGHIDGATIRRVGGDDPGLRIYEAVRGNRRLWIAWHDAGRVIFPGDRPTRPARIDTGLARVRIEPVITEIGQEAPTAQVRATERGALTLELSPVPVYILPQP